MMKGREIGSGLKNWGPPRVDFMDFSLDIGYKLVSFLLFCRSTYHVCPGRYGALADGNVLRNRPILVIGVCKVCVWLNHIGHCEFTARVGVLVCGSTRARSYTWHCEFPADDLHLRTKIRGGHLFLIGQRELYEAIFGITIVVDFIDIYDIEGLNMDLRV